MATRRTRQQLQFTGFEMAMLAVSFVVTATCVFFLGFYVGKKNAALHAPHEDRVARIPVDDFNKYTGAAAPAPGAAAAAVPAAKADTAKADDEADAKAVAVAKADAPAGEKKTDAASDKRRKKTDESPSADDAADDQDLASVAAGAAAAADGDAAAAESDDGDEEEEPARGAPGYTVQVLATRKEADAEALIKKLKARGYEAHVKRVSDGQTSWYRVRVGRFGGFGDARAMADRCRRELGLEQAFVSTE